MGFCDRKIFARIIFLAGIVYIFHRTAFDLADIHYLCLAERYVHNRHHGKEKDGNAERNHHPRLFEVAIGVLTTARKKINEQPDEAAQDGIKEQPGHHEQQEHGAVHRPAVHGEEGFQIR